MEIFIFVMLQDKMNRQLSCLIDNQVDSPVKLADELVQHGFIHQNDTGAIQEMLEAAITKYSTCDPGTAEHLPLQYDGVVQYGCAAQYGAPVQ